VYKCDILLSSSLRNVSICQTVSKYIAQVREGLRYYIPCWTSADTISSIPAGLSYLKVPVAHLILD
jgi:hypothetical protein